RHHAQQALCCLGPSASCAATRCSQHAASAPRPRAQQRAAANTLPRPLNPMRSNQHAALAPRPTRCSHHAASAPCAASSALPRPLGLTRCSQHAASAPRPHAQQRAAANTLPRLFSLISSKQPDASAAPRPHDGAARCIDSSVPCIYLGAACPPLSCTSATWCPSSRPRILLACVVLLGRMALATTPTWSPRLRRAPWPHV
ncbi:unnamed protein product, partial [Musa acuminata var. zebrina]